MSRVLMLRPSFFAPLAPPISLALLKATAEGQEHEVHCVDLNTDERVWSIQREYTAGFEGSTDYLPGDGFTRLWWVLTTQCLAALNGCDPPGCARILEEVLPQHGFVPDPKRVQTLLEVVQRYFSVLESVAQELDLARYDIVGTSTCTTSLPASLLLLRRAKQSNPHLVTLMGGGLFASDFVQGSENFKALCDAYDFVDHFVVGEGEEIFKKLVGGQRFSDRVLTAGMLGEKAFVDLDAAPLPDFTDFGKDYLALASEGSRGCPFKCEFCSETTFWGKFRKKSIPVLVDQLTTLSQRHGSKSFFLVDSLMNPYIDALAEAVTSRGLQLSFDGYLRAERSLDEKRCTALALAGLRRARIGCESASPRVLALMNKRTTPETMSDSLRHLAQAGIRTTTYWVVGFPDESEADFEESLDFIRKHHELIYELEGHPCEHYEKGQPRSGVAALQSVYSEQTTSVTHFKVWDVAGEPSRAVRHERLRRMSDLARALGIPNIYSMKDWRNAERRWKSLRGNRAAPGVL